MTLCPAILLNLLVQAVFNGIFGVFYKYNIMLSTDSILLGFPGGSDGKQFACNAGDPGSILGLGRSPGEGNGYPLQYSFLENPIDRGSWWATVHGVAKSQT